MSGAGWFILILILLIPIAAASYIFYTRVRAKRAGQSPPPLSSYNPFSDHNRVSDIYPASSGIVGWAKSKYHAVKNRSTSGGAYEQPLSGGRPGRRGLDPDEAWDARLGNEADGYGGGGHYEEQELGLRDARGGYGNGTRTEQGHVLPEYGEERGRSKTRDDDIPIEGDQRGLGRRYDEEMAPQNPFEDANEGSLRDVSPRPADGEGHGRRSKESVDNGRSSIFHENM